MSAEKTSTRAPGPRAEPLQLGRPTAVPASPGQAVLDRVPNPHQDATFVTRFTAPEFTTLCPVTGQPDFATLVIDYVPKAWILESKVAQALPDEFPQRRRLSRTVHGWHRQNTCELH